MIPDTSKWVLDRHGGTGPLAEDALGNVWLIDQVCAVEPIDTRSISEVGLRTSERGAP